MTIEQNLLNLIPTSFADRYSRNGRDRIGFATAIKTLNTALRPFLSDLAGVREYPVNLIVAAFEDPVFGLGSIKLKAQLIDGFLVLVMDHRRQTPILFGTGPKTIQQAWMVEHRATEVNIKDGNVVLIQTGIDRWHNNDPRSDIYTADLDTAYPRVFRVDSFFEKAKTLAYVTKCILDPAAQSKETPPLFYD